jgi:hypothetical protein
VLLLLAGAELHQHRAQHGDVEDLGQRRRRAEQLVHQDQALQLSQLGPAEGTRPVRCGPAAFVQDALPGHGVLLARRVALAQPLADVIGQAVVHEGTHLVAKGPLRGAEVEVHRRSCRVC